MEHLDIESLRRSAEGALARATSAKEEIQPLDHKERQYPIQATAEAISNNLKCIVSLLSTLDDLQEAAKCASEGALTTNSTSLTHKADALHSEAQANRAKAMEMLSQVRIENMHLSHTAEFPKEGHMRYAEQASRSNKFPTF
jgi:hypothetical protein